LPSADHTHLPGNFIVIPAPRTLSAVWEGPATVLLVEISGFSVSFDAAPFEPVLDGRDDFVTHVILALRDLARSRPESEAECGESLCAVLVKHMTRSASARRSARIEHGQALSSPRLRRVLEYVDAHLDEGISLSMLAHESGTSPFHFSRLFKRRTGLAPHQFIIHKRIERARSLLSDADPVDQRGRVPVWLLAAESLHLHLSTDRRRQSERLPPPALNGARSRNVNAAPGSLAARPAKAMVSSSRKIDSKFSYRKGSIRTKATPRSSPSSRAGGEHDTPARESLLGRHASDSALVYQSLLR
jgi:AraC-like DNA-binding protein